jgi:hypothetical protein
MQENNDVQEHEEASPPPETIELLEAYKKKFTLLVDHFRSRAARTEVLQQRRSASVWIEKKRNRMLRRYQTATAAVFESEQLLNQVEVRLQQLCTVDS